jgi:hypothetical protein
LQEVGYEDIFNTDEINEIKELYDKAQGELAESLKTNEANSFGMAHTKKLEDRLLNDEALK